MSLDFELLGRLGFFDFVPPAALERVLGELREESHGLPDIEELARVSRADAEELCDGSVTRQLATPRRCLVPAVLPRTS